MDAVSKFRTDVKNQHDMAIQAVVDFFTDACQDNPDKNKLVGHLSDIEQIVGNLSAIIDENL